MFIASALMIASTVVVAALPSDAVSVYVAGEATVVFNKEMFGGVAGRMIDAINQPYSVMTVEGIGDHAVTVTAEQIGGAPVIDAHVDEILVKSGDLVPMILLALVNVAGILVCLFFFKALMRELSITESPFTDSVVLRLRNFAISLLPAAVVSSVSETLITHLFSINRSLSMSLNLGPVVFAAVVYVLVMIFRYGVQLQQESDETL